MAIKYLLFIGLMLTGLSAEAYIGPGMGAGLIATIFGVLGAIILALFGLLYYPVKRFLKKRKAAKPDDDRV
jgi:hypothetical protein